MAIHVRAGTDYLNKPVPALEGSTRRESTNVSPAGGQREFDRRRCRPLQSTSMAPTVLLCDNSPEGRVRDGGIGLALSERFPAT